jgi:hypothetical protein
MHFLGFGCCQRIRVLADTSMDDDGINRAFEHGESRGRGAVAWPKKRSEFLFHVGVGERGVEVDFLGLEDSFLWAFG